MIMIKQKKVLLKKEFIKVKSEFDTKKGRENIQNENVKAHL